MELIDPTRKQRPTEHLVLNNNLLLSVYDSLELRDLFILFSNQLIDQKRKAIKIGPVLRLTNETVSVEYCLRIKNAHVEWSSW